MPSLTTQASDHGSRRFAGTTDRECSSKSIQRELGRLAAQIRRRIQRLAVDRAVVVLAGERWVPERRRKCVIGEFAVTGQHFNAGIEPGAPADVDAGASLLVGHIGTVRSVIGAAALIELTLGLGVGR